MAAASTIEICRTVLRSDPAVDAATREAVLDLLKGVKPARHLSPKQAMERLGCKKTVFWQNVKNGRWPFALVRRNARVVLIPEEQVEAAVRGEFGGGVRPAGAVPRLSLVG